MSHPPSAQPTLVPLEAAGSRSSPAPDLADLPRAAAGDPAAIARLELALRAPLDAAVAGLLRWRSGRADPDRVCEVTEQILAMLGRSGAGGRTGWAGFDPDRTRVLDRGAVLRWLKGIARNWILRPARELPTDLDVLAEIAAAPPPPEDLDDPAVAERILDALERSLATLEPDQRRLLEAKLARRPSKAIAAELGISPGAVDNRHYRTLARLQERLDAEVAALGLAMRTRAVTGPRRAAARRARGSGTERGGHPV